MQREYEATNGESYEASRTRARRSRDAFRSSIVPYTEVLTMVFRNMLRVMHKAFDR